MKYEYYKRKKYVIMYIGCDCMADEKIIKLQHFFEVDIRIKKEMISIAPPTNNQYIDNERYADSINDFLIYTFSELKCIASDLFGFDSFIMQKISMLENQIKNNFYLCGFDIEKLRLFYKNCISNMEIDFINSVKKECVGYTMGGIDSVQKANTINEILHFMHSFILNCESILQSIPPIVQKINDYEYPIVLRGTKVPIFEQLFAAFPNEIDVGLTDMVAINERKLIMMVRDRGHALTIEITLNAQTARLDYFIPKLCNIDMINSLSGINKVNENSIGATGVIEVPIDDLANTLFDFISKVPMDSDIVSKHY